MFFFLLFCLTFKSCCCCSVPKLCPTLQHHGLHAAHHASLSTTPGVCSNSCPLSRWCHPIFSSSVVPFSSCLQPLPASGSSPMSQPFAWGGQSIRAATSGLPMSIQGWFPLGLTGLISLQSKGFSRVFSPTPQCEGINSSALSLLYGTTGTSTHDHWKNHSFDYMNFPG